MHVIQLSQFLAASISCLVDKNVTLGPEEAAISFVCQATCVVYTLSVVLLCLAKQILFMHACVAVLILVFANEHTCRHWLGGSSEMLFIAQYAKCGLQTSYIYSTNLTIATHQT